MAAFIHAEVSWAERPSVVSANVGHMLQSVAHYPWAATSVDDVSSDSVGCVMGVQRGDIAAGEESDLPGADAPVRIAADVQLHARTSLMSQLGLTRGQESLLSDEALILRAYRRWGVEFADRIIGDGAFALWDASEQRLICWRDAAGVRPLYYFHTPGRSLVVSSDLQSIAAHPGAPSTLDLPYTAAFLRSELFQHPTRTMIEGVSKLLPAHILVFDRRGLRVQRYWEPRRINERATADAAECGEELRELLRRAISDRLPASSEGAGAHLSGGLDSSSVALTAAALLRDRGYALPVFSWSPPWEVVPAVARDERDLVETAAKFGSLHPYYTHLTPADVVAVAYRDVALRPRVTLNFEVATSRSAVERGVRTILSGWGGDEVVALNGRGHFADLARRGRLATVQRELKMRRGIHGGSLRGAWKARVVTPLLPDLVLRNGSGRPRSLPAELRPEFSAQLAAIEPLEHLFPRERPGVHRMQTSLLDYGHLHSRMEAWAAHGAGLGLTYTFPLLDRRIMEFALGLPGHMFFRDGWKRWLYRTAMEGVLPDELRWNPTKFDDAASRHLRSVLIERAEVYQERLLQRKDNDLVDIDVLLAEQDRQHQLRSSLNGSPPPVPDTPVGSGAWLAFTRLRPA